MKLFNFFKQKSFLGVDIGTAAIKVVQLSKERDTYRLENYGEIKFAAEEAPMEVYQQSSLKMLDEQVASLIKKIIAKTGITATQAALSLPVFSSFSTIIELPPMPKDEMEKAIQFEARQYVPIPISEVSLDSIVIGEEHKIHKENGGSTDGNGQQNEPQTAKPQRKKHVEVLLVAVPNEIKKKYQRIAELSGLNLIALEMETFPLARALLKGDPTITIIADVGARSTDICIVDNGFVRISHNFEFSGVDITKAYAEFAKLNFIDAERAKKVTGLNLTPGQLSEAKALVGIVDSIINEIDRIIHSYFNKTGREVKQVVLAGGVSFMPGFVERLQEKLNTPVIMGKPFENIVYQKELEKTLTEIGPTFGVAVGLAMRR
ncbi:MAG: pilus assembly protein PilM [Candidatus Azambacteria bacterium]|nr:pilus assembly protein PilM [Candidatus Azambacteria bacterium]